MATFRCNSCRGLYLDPQPPGVRYFHACPPLVDQKTGARAQRADHRDENYVFAGLRETPAGFAFPPAGEEPPIVAEGAGRTKLADEDLLTGASPDELKRLQEV